MCVFSEDFKSHPMSNMFGDTNETSTLFWGIGRVRGILILVKTVINRLPVRKIQQWADIGRDSSCHGIRNTLDGIVVRVVEEEADIKHA